MEFSRLAAARPPAAESALESIVKRLQAGDETALEAFVESTQTVAFKLAWHMLRDYHTAQDVVQEAYMAAFRTVRTLRDRRVARSWFLRIVSNRCIGLMRSQANRQPVELPPDLVDERCLQESTGRRLALRQALAALSDTDRNVIVLREVLDLPYEDIATILAVPVGTVKSRLSEARRRLARQLSQEGL
jgi:RNA polymerase sigma-70 factor (ECF subfamily)